MLYQSSATFCLILCVLLPVSYVGAKELPSWVPRCRADDPRLNDCLLKSMQVVRERMLDGIPELQIPSMNPLVLPEVRLDNGPSFKARFTNISIYQATMFQVDNLNIDLPKNHMDMKVTFPTLRILSQYDVDGRILILEVKGAGPADGNYTNVQADMVVDGSRYKKNGKEYLSFDKKTLNLNLGKAVLHFDRIFGDNVELNDQTNKVINDNIDSIVEELKPIISDAVTQFVFGLVNRIFAKFSFDELFIV